MYFLTKGPLEVATSFSFYVRRNTCKEDIEKLETRGKKCLKIICFGLGGRGDRAEEHYWTGTKLRPRNCYK